MHRPLSTQHLLFPEYAPEPEVLADLDRWLRAWIADQPEAAQDSDLALARVETPLGPMMAAASSQGLALLEFAERDRLETQLTVAAKRAGAAIAQGGGGGAQDQVLAAATDEIEEYFAGERRKFDVALTPSGTAFQREVWDELLKIPFGERRSYGDLAVAIDRPKAARAVGMANGLNPLAIIQPCHRVVGADGTLTGYGGGLWRKRRLLELEGA